MSTSYAGRRRVDDDHFHPDAGDDPAEQRRRRGQLEAIDYTAFACNREVVGRVMGPVGPTDFQGLALACAQARAAWVAEAFRSAGDVRALDGAALNRLSSLRRAFEELSQAYDAARRMVERGYLPYDATPRA